MSEPEIRLSRREAERLLDAPAAHDSALGWALSAACAPAHPGELRREEAMVAAFHQARVSPPPARRGRFVSPVRLGGRAATQAVIATAAVVALASGGFALAGSFDLPTLPGQASDRATESVAKNPRPAKTVTSTDGSGGSATNKPTETAGGSAQTPKSTPSPNLKGLCTAYQATDRSDGKSLDSAAFTALATAADGADRIAAYCVALIGEPTSRPTDAPTTGRPTDKPTPGKPTQANPTPGKPTDKPTDKPTPDKPTQANPTPGKPTDKPTDKPTPDKPTQANPAPGKTTEEPTDTTSPGKPTDKPAPGGTGGGKDSSTSGS